MQILRVAKALAHTAKFRSGLVNGGGDMGGQREQLERALDVLVGTPQRVMQHAGAPALAGRGPTQRPHAEAWTHLCCMVICVQITRGGQALTPWRPLHPRHLAPAPTPPLPHLPRADKAHLYYGDVEVVVLDEADTMFDRGFGPEVGAGSRALGRRGARAPLPR